MKRNIFYENNIGYIKLKNCKPRPLYINSIGKYYLKRCNKTKTIQEVYIPNL